MKAFIIRRRALGRPAFPTFFLLFFFSLSAWSTLDAQSVEPAEAEETTPAGARLSVHFGAAFPLGEFADDDPDDFDSGVAGTGINLGGQLTYPLNEKGLGVFAGLDILYNDIQQDEKDRIEDLFASVDADINKFSKYLNFSLSGGLRFDYAANTKTGLFCQAGITANFLKVTDFELEFDNRKYFEKYDLSNAFGVNIGGGIILNSKTVLRINYISLGDFDVDGEYENPDGLLPDFEDRGRLADLERQIRLLTFTIGIQL